MNLKEIIIHLIPFNNLPKGKIVSHLHLMHPKDFVCVTQSSDLIKVCPEYFLHIVRDVGCKSIRCYECSKCGTIFCYECGIKLQTQTEAYTHFIYGHPKKKSNENNNDDSNINDDNDNSNDNDDNNDYSSFSVNSIFGSIYSETTYG